MEKFIKQINLGVYEIDTDEGEWQLQDALSDLVLKSKQLDLEIVLLFPTWTCLDCEIEVRDVICKSCKAEEFYHCYELQHYLLDSPIRLPMNPARGSFEQAVRDIGFTEEGLKAFGLK